MTASPLARRCVALAAIAILAFAGCASASETLLWRAAAEMQWPGAAKALDAVPSLGFGDKAKTKGPVAMPLADILETGFSLR